MNYFDHPDAAKRYALGRPYYHPLVMAKLRDRVGRVAAAADVACGTGLSTGALLEVAEKIWGFDLSADMLAQVEPDARITYEIAPAEKLPLPDASVQVLTMASAFHWVGRGAFLMEARRVMTPDGLLVIYDHNFLGELPTNAEFKAWMWEHYFPRYPIPPRDRTPFGSEEARAAGFRFEGERFTHALGFTSETLVTYTDSEKFVRISQTFPSGASRKKIRVLRRGATAGVVPGVAQQSGIRIT